MARTSITLATCVSIFCVSEYGVLCWSLFFVMPIYSRYRRRRFTRRSVKFSRFKRTRFVRKRRFTRYPRLSFKRRRFGFRRKKGIHVRAKRIGSRMNTFHRVIFGRYQPGLNKIMQKISARNYFKDNNGGLLSSVIGQQNQVVTVTMTRGSLRTLASLMDQQGALSTDGNIANTKRWFLNRSEVNIRFTNLGSAPAEGWIAYYMYKQSTDNTFNDLWEAGMDDMTETTANTDVTYVGNVPFGVIKVSCWLKLMKVVHVEILPGETHIQQVKYNFNRMINNELIYGVDPLPEFIGGLSVVQVANFHGGACLGATTATVTTAPVKIGVITDSKTSCGYISDNDYNMGLSMGLSRTTQLGNAYNMGSGLVTTVSTV